MAYIDLSNEAMVGISATWTSEGDVRKRVKKYRPLAGLLELVDRAHGLVLEITQRAAGSPHAARLKDLVERSTAADGTHDGSIRAGVGILEAAEALAPRALAARIAADRAAVHPRGIALVSASYADESGAAVVLETRLADDSKLVKRLERIKLVIEPEKGPAMTFSVADLARRQIEAGKVLAATEQERRGLEGGAPLSSRKKVTPNFVSNARTAWVRAVTLLVDAADEMETFEAEDRSAIFGPLAKALESVERKSAESGSDATTEGSESEKKE
jgi:hypothetical protein